MHRQKILLLDVDGVFTDSKLYYVKNGLGIKLAQRANVRIDIISEPGIEEIHLGFNNKLCGPYKSRGDDGKRR